MKPHRLVAALALALTALAVAGGSSSRARAETCRHADAVFYSTDTLRLAQRLGANQSPCTDYYISVTPTGAGLPRSGVAPTVHAQGPHFHAMPELDLKLWAARVQSTGESWFDAGVEARKAMGPAGFNPALGDTWMINELGTPSSKQMALDVVAGAGSARGDLREFVRGLYTGAPGMPPAPGVVFAADPPQITTDLAQYKAQLESWFADSDFWSDMSRYVRFWAQETYADARDWGVLDTTLAQRSDDLDDYYFHALRLADTGPGKTDAARSFLDTAYTPIGNASYRSPAPAPNAIGFGLTDLPLPSMKSFVTAQTAVLRGASDRFGYAWAPRQPVPPAADLVALADRLAASIHDSDAGPVAACGASGDLCDGVVDGAQFNPQWKTFATWDPPTNTPEGQGVRVQPAPGIAVTFASVSSRGSTQASEAADVPAPPDRFQLRPGEVAHKLTTTADFSGEVDVCVDGNAALYSGYAPHLFQLVDGAWRDVTTTVDTTGFCGRSEALGTFAIFAGDPTPPSIVSHVDGPLGTDGWYVGNVTVTWEVSDPQSAFTTCAPRVVDFDTAGTAVTCSSTSDGGTASATVTVKRDTTPPALSVEPVVVDAAGPAGAVVTYEAVATDALDPAPSVVCLPASGTTFPIGTSTVSCTATDDAGNSTPASFTIHVQDAAEQLHDLAAAVDAATGIPHGLATALLAHLDAALARLDPADPARARPTCAILAAFSALVRNGERVGHVSQPTGKALAEAAERITAVLGC